MTPPQNPRAPRPPAPDTSPHAPPTHPPQVITVASTGKVFKAGAYISINGTTGEVIRGAQPVAKPSSESGDLSTFMKASGGVGRGVWGGLGGWGFQPGRAHTMA